MSLPESKAALLGSNSSLWLRVEAELSMASKAQASCDHCLHVEGGGGTDGSPADHFLSQLPGTLLQGKAEL